MAKADEKITPEAEQPAVGVRPEDLVARVIDRDGQRDQPDEQGHEQQPRLADQRGLGSVRFEQARHGSGSIQP